MPIASRTNLQRTMHVRRPLAPMRGYRRDLRVARIAGRTTWRVMKLVARAGAARAVLRRSARGARSEIGGGFDRGWRGFRGTPDPLAQAPRERKRAIPSHAAAVLGGAAAMYFLDTAQGRRRRALARDRLTKAVRRGRREEVRRAHYAEAAAAAKPHGVQAERSRASSSADDVALAVPPDAAATDN